MKIEPPFEFVKLHGLCIDMTGQTIGRLLVLGHVGGGKFACQCDCGGYSISSGSNLRQEYSTSCGCLRTERGVAARRSHGDSNAPLYRIWNAIKNRCTNPNVKAYARYGGRGVKICDRWLDYETFKSDVGERPSAKHQLDRKNNDGNYEPGNVRWATPKVQANNRRSSLHVMVRGEMLTPAECADKYGLSYSAVYQRVRRGWCDDCILAPQRKRSCTHKSARKEKALQSLKQQVAFESIEVERNGR